MDCLQRAVVPLACFTSPLSAALVSPLTGVNRVEKGKEDCILNADKLCWFCVIECTVLKKCSVV